MDKDRQAIINHHRAARLEAEAGDAGSLAEVERAALSFAKKVADERQRLEQENRLTPQAIGKEIASLVTQWHGEKPQLETRIATIEERSKFDEAPGLPERTSEHRDICAHFKELKGDRRQEAIARAISGKDDTLALALATENPIASTLTDFDRDLLIKRVSPDDLKRHQARSAEIEKRIAGARATLAEVTQRITGVTQ